MSSVGERAGAAQLRLMAVALIGLIVSGFFLYATYTRTLMNPDHLTWSKWAYSEWLIDYGAGFIRRGLAGAAIHHLTFGGSSIAAVNAIVFWNCAIFALAFLALLVASKNVTVASAALTVLMPGLIYNLAISGEFFFRKEVAFWSFLAVSALMIRLVSVSRPWALAVARPFILLLMFGFAFLCMLIHEGFLFLGAPVASLLIYAGLFRDRRVLGRNFALAYAAWCLGLFVVCSAFKGNLHSAQVIWQGLSSYDRSAIAEPGEALGAPLGGISAIAWGLRTAIFLFFRTLLSGALWYWVFTILATCLFVQALPLCRRGEEGDLLQVSKGWVGTYLVLAALISPMFVLGMDWGRWIVDLNVTYVILFLALSAPPIPPEVSSRVVPSWLWDRAPRTVTPLLVVGLIVVGLSFEVPECCLKGTAPLMFDNLTALLATLS